MAEVILNYEATMADDSGRRYDARACGRPRADGTWEGWLEFVPLDGGPVVHTARETTQSDWAQLRYWAGGLTASYLDGALLRTLKAAPAEPVVVREQAAAERPAPRRVGWADPSVTARPIAVIDPFAVFAQGDEVLRGQLRAMAAGQLRNIVKAYRLSSLTSDELERLTEPELVGLIMGEVSDRADRRR